LFDRVGHPPVPTCGAASHRAQRRSRMAWRPPRQRREASCVLGMSSSLGVKVPCATWWRWSTSEAQGRNREGPSEGSVERNRDL